jgi:predicted membrane-bound dolichyl-phosphate-mannose-protein mannosyltransferase
MSLSDEWLLPLLFKYNPITMASTTIILISATIAFFFDFDGFEEDVEELSLTLFLTNNLTRDFLSYIFLPY